MSVVLDQLLARGGRHLFLPIGFRFLLRVEQVTWTEFCDDPALAAFTLRGSQRLFKADGLVNWFDSWLEVEGVGTAVERDDLGIVQGSPAPPGILPSREAFADSRPIRRSIELATRLCNETGNAASVLGYLTGIHTLLVRLFGTIEARRLARALAQGSPRGADKDAVEAAVGLSLVLANAYCEAGCGALLITENEPTGDQWPLSALAPVRNLADYYGIPILLLCRHPVGEAGQQTARAAGIRHVASPGASDGLQMVPEAVLMADAERAASWARALPPAGAPRLFLTEWEIPTSAVPEAVIALQKMIVA
jgi:hypothetical protein